MRMTTWRPVLEEDPMQEQQELEAIQLSQSLRKAARMATQLAVHDLEHALAVLRLSGLHSDELAREAVEVRLQLRALRMHPAPAAAVEDNPSLTVSR